VQELKLQVWLLEEVQPGVNTNATEEYDGSAWAGGGNLGIQQEEV
jgi:hypothetical protein